METDLYAIDDGNSSYPDFRGDSFGVWPSSKCDPNTVSFTLSLAGLLFSFFFMGWVFDKYFFPWLCSVGLREDPEVEAMIKELEAMS